PDADAAKLIQGAKEAKAKPDAFLKYINEEVKELKGDKARDVIQGYVDKLKKSGNGEEVGYSPAKLVVRLPADATLAVDEKPTASTSAERKFTSPPLKYGVTYFYDLKAEIERNGEKLVVAKRVSVRAGEETQVVLDAASAVAVAKK